MRNLAPISFGLFFLFTGSATAAPGCVVFSSQAQGLNGRLVSLEVGKGHGLNANFIPTGETIQKVWIDDQTQVGVSFDGELCQWTSEKQADCADTGASVIHLRQTDLINFPNLPRSQNGSTLLSAITQGDSGRKLYQFSVTPVAKKPDCSSITIVPDPERLDPILPGVARSSNTQWQPQSPINSQPQAASSNQAFTSLTPTNNPTDSATSDATTPLTNSPLQVIKQPTTSNTSITALTTKQPQFTSIGTATQLNPKIEQAHDYANAAQRGLEIAVQTGQIKPNSSEWKNTTSAITWLRQGMNLDEAASRAKIPLPMLTELISLGQ